MNGVFTRTSIRQYTDKKIPDEITENLLRAAFCAPSAMNRQPWQFIVVQNPKALKEIASFSPYASSFARGVEGIVVLGQAEDEKLLAYTVLDCAAATENLLVEAANLGLGSCWLGIYPEKERMEKVRNYFDLPNNIVPLWLISLGYPKKETEPKDKWDPSKIHYEKY